MTSKYDIRCVKCGKFKSSGFKVFWNRVRMFGSEERLRGCYVCRSCRPKFPTGRRNLIECNKCSRVIQVTSSYIRNGIIKFGDEAEYRRNFVCVGCRPRTMNHRIVCNKCCTVHQLSDMTFERGIRKCDTEEIFRKKYLCKQCRPRITLNELASCLKGLYKDRRLTMTEFRNNGRKGFSRPVISRILSENNLTLSELARQIGVVFVPTRKGIGKDETQILDGYEQTLGYKIERQRRVKGYKLDGYDPFLNIAYEIDESYHKYQKVEDLIRESEIREVIGCKFVRIPT